MSKRAEMTQGSVAGSRTSPLQLEWSEWMPLLRCWTGGTIPTAPGLYRVRCRGQEHLDYVGQTGDGTMNLRKRLAMLAGVVSPEMPYRDPHTAAPALWALTQEGATLDVSVAVVLGEKPWRLGVEAVQIALHRQVFGHSPTVNFGRMPDGYRMSSGNNARLVAAGKRFRGGRCACSEPCHERGVPPLAEFDGPPQAPNWHDLGWSPWEPLRGRATSFRTETGVYRIRGDVPSLLLYVGQGSIESRVAAHAAKLGAPGHAQGAIFRAQTRIECSFVANGAWSELHRLEIENDLIAAHILATMQVPRAQFLG